MIVTGRQIATARALLGMAQSDLAERSSISVATLKWMKASPGEAMGLTNTIRAVRQTLEAAGVIFIETNGEGPGVRLRKAEG